MRFAFPAARHLGLDCRKFATSRSQDSSRHDRLEFFRLDLFVAFSRGTDCDAYGSRALDPPGRREDYGALAFAVERQLLFGLVPIDDQHVAETHLLGRSEERRVG